MKIKLTKDTLNSIKVILLLLVMLIVVLYARHNAKTKGETTIKSFFDTIGVTQ